MSRKRIEKDGPEKRNLRDFSKGTGGSRKYNHAKARKKLEIKKDPSWSEKGAGGD